MNDIMKTVRDRFDESDRAVSPVIGVILMVAITVILAAVIGTFVLDLGSDVQENPRAGVSFDQISDTEVDVTLTNLGNLRDAGDLTVDSNEACGDTPSGGESFVNVGGTVSLSSCSSDDRIVVLGELGGQNSTIASYRVK